MNPLISVIVPIYNVEKYLDRCVESLVNQTYENLEIILVDDGSPDNCPKICDEWAGRDSRIKVIHKENGGVSSARNMALDVAEGEYVAFLDGDDFVDCEMLSVLMKNAEINNSELVSCLYRFYYDENNKVDENFYIDFGAVKGNKEIFIKFFDERFISPGVSTKIYLKQIIDNNNLRFSTSLKVAEDYLFNYYYLQHCQCVVSLDSVFYNYFIREDSAYHSVSKSVIERWKVTRFIIDDYAVDDEVMQSIKKKYANELLSCAKEIMFAGKKSGVDLNDSYFEIVDEIKKNYKDFSKYDFSIVNKIKMYLIRILPRLYRSVFTTRYSIRKRGK